VCGEVLAASSRRRSIPRADSRCSVEATARTANAVHSALLMGPPSSELRAAKAVMATATTSTTIT
jgi:hypothetical protein